MAAISKSTLNDLITKLRFRIGDNAESIDSDVLTLAIKEAVAFIAKTTECFVKTDALSVTANTVTLTDVFVTIQSVYDTSSGVNQVIPQSNIREYNEMSRALKCWFLKNDAMFIANADGSSPTTVEITYSYIPNIASESISEKFVPSVLAYALYRMRDVDRDSGLADRPFSELSLLTGVEVVKRDETTLNNDRR